MSGTAGEDRDEPDVQPASRAAPATTVSSFLMTPRNSQDLWMRFFPVGLRGDLRASGCWPFGEYSFLEAGPGSDQGDEVRGVE